jgi:formylglycine-generating enzyme required for sulfatase activity
VAALTARIDRQAAQDAADSAQTRDLLEALSEQVRLLNDRIDLLQQSPQPVDQAKAKRLDKVRSGLLVTVSSALATLAVRTTEAMYDGWVQENLLPLLPDWVQRPWVAFAQGEQPTSPLVQPASPVSQPDSPLPTPDAEPAPRGADRVQLPEMVYVPPGWFLMGSDKRRDPQARDNELPQHWVWLDGYWIGKYPITNEQYAAFVRASGHEVPDDWTDGVIPRQKEHHPVGGISWHDAQAYCKWLGAAAGRPFRLPTEAEWEKAARGSDGRVYPWGLHPDPRRANYADTGIRDTSAIGQFPLGVSPYGCHDMAGNVWEWTNSLDKPYPYNAADGREGTGSWLRVLRGGTYLDSAQRVRCASRRRDDPYDRDGYFGFRVVLSPSPLNSEPSDL